MPVSKAQRAARAAMVGKSFGRLTIIEEAGRSKSREVLWVCRCRCGTVTQPICQSSLNNGHTLSCGCLRLERLRATLVTHGLTNYPEYRAWLRMIRRCHRPSGHDVAAYAERGITVCEEWRNSPEAFCAYVGPRPSPAHSIDRINNDGNYEPGNVRWATRTEQQRNRRCSVVIQTHDGRVSLQDFAKQHGLLPDTVRSRIADNWPVEKLGIPVLPKTCPKRPRFLVERLVNA